MTLGFQMKQLFGNNSVVVSGSASLPIVSAGSLATMMQVSPAQKKSSCIIKRVGSFQFSVVVPTRDLCKDALSTVLPWQAFCRVRSGTGMLIK